MGDETLIAGRFNECYEEEVKLYGSTGTTIRWLINKENGARNFAMRRFRVEPGGKIPLHDHEEDHGIYILSGEGIAFTQEQEVNIKSDMFLYIPSNEIHGYRNTGNLPLEFICVIPILE